MPLYKQSNVEFNFFAYDFHELSGFILKLGLVYERFRLYEGLLMQCHVKERYRIFKINELSEDSHIGFFGFFSQEVLNLFDAQF